MFPSVKYSECLIPRNSGSGIYGGCPILQNGGFEIR